MGATSPSILERAATRLRLVGMAALAGALAVVVWLVARLAVGDFPASVETTFAVGSLAFGPGLLGQSEAAVLGRGIKSMQAHLDTGADWMEADVRQTMTRVPGFGLGTMLEMTAVGLATSVFVVA